MYLQAGKVSSSGHIIVEKDIMNFLNWWQESQKYGIDKNVEKVRFHYHKESCKIYTCTPKMAKKVQNIRRNPDKIYFSIDDENYPYKGVKGRAVARISEDIQRNLPIMEKINLKYLGTLEHPLAKMLMENTRNGIEVAIEITPKFFSAWDFGKAM